MNTNHSKKRGVESQLFEQRLNQNLESEKSKDMRRYLKCFQDYGEHLAKKQHQEEQKEGRVKQLLSVQMRLLKINQLKRYLQFKSAWDSKSKKQWLENLQTRKQHLEILKKIGMAKMSQKAERSEKMRQQMRSLTFQNIHDFEQRLQQAKAKTQSNSQSKVVTEVEEEKMTVGFFNQIVQMSQFAHYNPDMAEIIEQSKEREKNLHSEEFKKERDKRIRKMIVDLKKNKLESDFKIAEKKLLEKLTLESNQEEEIR